MLKRETLLPVGSIVTLKGYPEKKRMITGFYVVADNVLFDYCTVQYPLGEPSEEMITMTFADSIDKVLFRGYQGEGYGVLLDVIEEASNRFTNEIESGKLTQKKP